jgi:tRNA-2-methylthio-N6-dimethylallyladenosine synthase
MNVADSQRMASALEQRGYEFTPIADDADVIVMNTCVVRQSAEDRAYGRLGALSALKRKNPDLIINVMGCLVGFKGNKELDRRAPYVDVVSPPSSLEPLLDFLDKRDGRKIEQDETENRFLWQDGEMPLPSYEQDNLVSAYLPIVEGCSHACTYCIIPYRRGAEKSRSPELILTEARSMVNQGVKEITLLGQIVDRYGKDNPEYPKLAGLIRQIHEIEGLKRLRFLTSHPNWMDDELLDCVAELPKMMPHIEVPNQAGDDEVLANMKRGYTAQDYRELIHKIRGKIPGVSIGTDIIVGFPGETEEQFQNTYNLLAELKLDVVHLARYSSRTGTYATRFLGDDVSEEDKWNRFRLIEELQEGISAEIYATYLDQTVPVLFEDYDAKKNRWRGRTPTNKLVFVESEKDLRGEEPQVKITWTGPWSMRGELVED